MIFGDKKYFAIEAYLDQRGDYVFINYCFWLRSKMVGDLNQSCLLKSVIPILDSILKYQGQRNFRIFEKYSDQDVTNYLIKKLWKPYDESISTDIEIELEVEDLKILNINSQEGECFQGFYTFIIESETYDRLLFKNTDNKSIVSFKSPKNLFYNQIKAFSLWIQASTKLVLK